MKNALYEEIDRLTRENKILTAKTTNSLANNLCPDHRDKQAGKSCLACEIERLKKVNGELVEALKATLPILAYPSVRRETVISVVREMVKAAIRKAVQP